MRKKGGRKGARKCCSTKLWFWYPLWFRYSLVAFQNSKRHPLQHLGDAYVVTCLFNILFCSQIVGGCVCNFAWVFVIVILFVPDVVALFLHGPFSDFVCSTMTDRRAWKQPLKQQTETPTSTMALMGRCPSLMRCFPSLIDHFAEFAFMGRFPFENALENIPLMEN